MFSTPKARDNMIAKIKQKTGFDCFVEQSGGKSFVYCGSFKDKQSAQQRVNQLKAKGFSAFVKEVQV